MSALTPNPHPPPRGNAHGLHVLWAYELATADEGMRLTGPEQSERAARAHTQLQLPLLCCSFTECGTWNPEEDR